MNHSIDKRAGFGALFATLRVWYRRECERYELSRMRLRDFGDLPVPPDLICEETRRWPWQKPSPQWSQIDAWRGSGRERSTAQQEQQAAPAIDGRDPARTEPVPLILL
jgi:hypothetical protein